MGPAANEQLREQRVELSRVRDELQQVKIRGRGGEGWSGPAGRGKRAEQARVDAERREQDRKAAEASLKQTLAKFGTIKAAPNGFQLILPESIWTGARASNLISAAAAKLEPLAACWPAIPITRS